MQLERLVRTAGFTVVTQNTSLPVAAAPPRSVTGASQQVKLDLALAVIPRPVPSAPGPSGFGAPIPFRPGTLAGSDGRSVVFTPAGGMKASEFLANARTETDILNRARQAGLSPDECKRLQQILDSSPDFKTDARLLEEVLGGVNGDRAARTFMDLDQMRRAHPDRITPDVVSSLVEGVAKSKSPGEEDEFEGVLGEDAARRAAQALIAMPQGDYNAIHDALNQAGHGGDAAFDDPGTERALILKAVAARAGRYEHPTVDDSRLRPETLEIETFANQIRGMNWTDLIARTTVTAGDGTLEQRFFDSCSAATAQMARAEADPIYAFKLHDEDVHSRDLNGFIANQQAEWMKQVGGVPVTFQELDQLDQISKAGGPMGAAAKAMHDQLMKYVSNEEEVANRFVSDATGRDYHSHNVDDSTAARTAAADNMEKLVRQGVDVPISVNWTQRNPLNPLHFSDTGLSHALLITDVRGKGADEVFVVADPGSGSTFEIKRSDLIAGEDFGGSSGRLSGFLS